MAHESVAGSTPRASGNSIRVLLFVNHFDQGGTESQLVHLANALHNDSRFDVHLGHHRSGPLRSQLQLANEKIRSYPLRRFYDSRGVREIFRLASHIDAHRFDIVHAQDFYANVMCAAAAAICRGVKLVLSRRYEIRSNRRIHRYGEWCSYRLADAVVMNSSRVAERLIATRFLPAHKAVVIPNGIDLHRFPEASSQRRGRALRPDDPCRIGIVARLHPVKGHSTLLKATKILVQRWKRLELLVIGDGECRRELENSAAELELTGHVKFLGTCSNIARVLETLDVAVLSSFHEALPNALLEYMACGIPVVASNVGGIPDLVSPDREALLVPRGESDSLATALERLLSDAPLRERLGRAGRQRAEEFSMERMVDGFRQLYWTMLAPKASHLLQANTLSRARSESRKVTD